MGDKVVADQLSEKNDINMVMVYSALASMLDSNPMVGSMPMMDALKGATLASSVNFEKGRIVCDAAMSYKDKESEQKMMDFYAYVKPQTGACCATCPGIRSVRCLRPRRREDVFGVLRNARLRDADGQPDGQAGDGCFQRRLRDLVLGDDSRRSVSRSVAAGPGEGSRRVADDRLQPLRYIAAF